MKILILFFLTIILYSCAGEKQVFWCGDHACVNKEEKMLYFKETMTVEVKKLTNISTDSDTDTVTKILKKEKKNKKIESDSEKKRLKAERKLAKQMLLEEKKNLKKEKKLAKQMIKDEKKRIKLEKKKIKKKSYKIKKEPIKTTAAKISSSGDSFNTLLKKVTNKNMLRPFPNINDIPN